MSTVHTTVQLHTTLWEGDVTERVTYQLYNRNITIDKLPRTLLDKYKEEDELQFSGIYFLTNSSVDNLRIYVGQAAKRVNGNGLMGRIREHDRQKDFWDTAYLIAPTDNSWEATELNYLESAFCRQAQKANRYALENGNIPFSGNIAKVKKAILRPFVHEVLLMLRASGHYMLEPVPTLDKVASSVTNSHSETEQNAQEGHSEETPIVATPFPDDSRPESHPAFTDAVFRIKRKKMANPARARIIGSPGERVNVEVFEGEVFPVRKPTKADPRYLKELEALEEARDKQRAAGCLEGLRIVIPIEFTSQSAASKFVVGSSSSGNADWVLESDPSISLGAFLQNLEGSQG